MPRSLLSDLLDDIGRQLAGWLARFQGPAKPGRAYVTLKEVFMAREKRYVPTFHFPNLDVDEDVEVRELTITIDGVSGPPTEFPDDAETTDLPPLRVGQAVEVSHVDLDAAGNRSQPRVLALTVEDTVAPPQPGEAGISARETYIDVDDTTGTETPAGTPGDTGEVV
jgi:hypothetical protein